HAPPPAVDGPPRRRGRAARGRRRGRAPPPRPARGARLPHAVRRSVVDGDPVGRLSARRRAPSRRAHVAREVRRVHGASRPGRDAGPAPRRAPVAVRRGAPDRRGHAPAHAPRRRALREGAAEPERRAAPARRAVEVRLQGHQVDRPHLARRAGAADHVERRRPARVRLLREREPGRGPPAVEPGDRAADRRAAPPADAAVQRLRRGGRVALRRHGPAAVVLSPKRHRPWPWLAPGVFAGALVPLAALLARAARGTLGADPIAEALNELGLLALVFLVAALGCTPAKALLGWTWPLRLRRMLGLFAFFYASLHLLTYA